MSKQKWFIVRLSTSLSCGNFVDPQKAFERTPAISTKYQKRIYGPLPYLIEINIEVLRVDHKKLSKISESSESIRKRTQTAKNIHSQIPPYNNRHRLQCRNASWKIRQVFQLQAEGQSLLRSVMSQLQLSARTYAQHME